eukprot:1415077-Alexandrium_andersonii.AAC.1
MVGDAAINPACHGRRTAASSCAEAILLAQDITSIGPKYAASSAVRATLGPHCVASASATCSAPAASPRRTGTAARSMTRARMPAAWI